MGIHRFESLRFAVSFVLLVESEQIELSMQYENVPQARGGVLGILDNGTHECGSQEAIIRLLAEFDISTQYQLSILYIPTRR